MLLELPLLENFLIRASRIEGAGRHAGERQPHQDAK
jgi:hypothetical protein